MATIDKTISVENIGSSSNLIMPENWRGIIITPLNHTITKVNALLSATWQEDLKNPKSTRIYLPPLADMTEINDESTIYQDTNIGKRLKVRDGAYRHAWLMLMNLDQFNALKTHDNSRKGIYILDDANSLIGTDPDDTEVTFNPIKCKVFIEKLRRNDGSNRTMAVLAVDVEDSQQIDKNGFLLPDINFIDDLYPLTTVKLVVEAGATASSLVVNVTNVHDGVGISGLNPDGSDFTIGSGTITGATEDTSNPGRYTIAGTTMAGDVGLVAASAISLTDNAIEMKAAVPSGI